MKPSYVLLILASVTAAPHIPFHYAVFMAAWYLGCSLYQFFKEA